MNGIEIEFVGADKTYSFIAPVVPPIGSEIYVGGYYYTVVNVEYYINSREYNHKLEATVSLTKLRQG
jgi:hypothetical protein